MTPASSTALITFTVVGYGSSDIILGDDTVLRSPTANIIDAAENPEQIGHGYFSNMSPPPPAITATVNIKPDSLNMKNKGQWIKAYIKLSEGYDVGDIDVSTILLNNTIPAISSRVIENKLTVRFDRTEVMALLSVGEATLTITGEVNGTPFEASGTIRVR